MADDVTKKDLQSLQGWVNAELKKRDNAIAKKPDSNELASARAADDLAARLSKMEGIAGLSQRNIAELEKTVDRLVARVQKLEK